MTTMQALSTVVIIAGVTFLTRIIPFVLFPAGRKTPGWVLYLGNVLPYAMMAMLVVYCLKGVQISTAPHGLPELIGVAIVAGLYLWRRNTLLSIGVGTVAYMLLVQLVFV